MRVTTTEASRIYRIPARTLQRWTAEGRLTSTRRGRSILLSCDELDQLTELRGDGRLPRGT
jgi:excisionase family DNA binding protein